MRLPELDLVLFTFGNASEADRSQEVFAIKPSGVPYNSLKVDDMVIVDFDGNVVEGDLRPSSDTKTHAVLYKNWDEIGGIVHTHSTYATAWAQSLTDLPILGTTHADHLAMDIPCTQPMHDDQIKGDYEYETGIQIISEFKERDISPMDAGMILVGSHAPFTWGKSAEDAVYQSAVLEEMAKMAAITTHINPDISKLKKSLINKHYDRKHGDDAYYGQS
jgi:L-ribulose-5-phosphate 4-epimerase